MGSESYNHTCKGQGVRGWASAETGKMRIGLPTLLFPLCWLCPAGRTPILARSGRGRGSCKLNFSADLSAAVPAASAKRGHRCILCQLKFVSFRLCSRDWLLFRAPTLWHRSSRTRPVTGPNGQGHITLGSNRPRAEPAYHKRQRNNAYEQKTHKIMRGFTWDLNELKWIASRE